MNVMKVLVIVLGVLIVLGLIWDTMVRKTRWWQYRVTPWLSNRYDKLCMFVAWHLMPHRLVNWAAVRLMAHGTVGKYSSQVVPELTCIEALGRWNGNDMRKSEAEARVEAKQVQMVDGHPRRSQMLAWVPAERAIYDAIQVVEGMPAHVLLTDAVILLGNAMDKVADFVELPHSIIQCGAWCQPIHQAQTGV